MAWNAGLRCGGVDLENRKLSIYTGDHDGRISINEDGVEPDWNGTNIITLRTNKQIDDLIMALIRARSIYYNDRC